MLWMRSMERRLGPLFAGGVSLGVLQALENVDFNSIWFQFITLLLSTFVSLLFGGDASQFGA